ncbi:MAG TPA: chorismate mutase [Candidatus Gastranaerophilaceae bacterium]|nr:chorismate mutase [Candidatus Gastranaerophilaceae bacterium]
MITKGIRGAITVEENTKEAIEAAVVELIEQIFFKNNIENDLISHIIFTTTKDLTAEFPAKIAREHFDLKNTAMICAQEINVENSLKMCLRFLIVVNCLENFCPKHVYLKGAKNLRPDIKM